MQLPTPGPQPPSSSNGSSPGAPGSSPSSSADDPAVVARNLNAPTALALLPDGTALVGERTTGRILRVQPRPSQPVQVVRTLAGVDGSGDGGLLDLAVSPTYGEDNLIYAYLTTATENRVVDFTLAGPVTPVVTGIPRGARDNVGRILFDSSGHLFVGTGDAGTPALAAQPTSLAGKVLRVDAIGHPADGNPNPGSPVYTSGHTRVDGLCQNPADGRLFEVERGTPDEVNVLSVGQSYAAGGAGPVTVLPTAKSGAGDCAVLSGQLYVTSLTGTALVSAPLSASGAVGGFSALLDGKYGRLLTVVAAPDGALWLTTSNKDGSGQPRPGDEKVLRITPSASGGGSPL